MKVDDLFNEDNREPKLLFLGTVSTSPSKFCSASAIYLMKNGRGILMDCSEGSYSQLMDHFNDKTIVDELLWRTNCVFITHIHGDHQLGVLKILHERDLLLQDKLSKAPEK